jgi:quercetin dioxygenase-like cupin family protein
MSEPYAHFPNIALEAGEIPPDSILSRTLYADEQVKVILFGFAQGQELSEHTASVPAIIHILQGQARLTLGGDSKEAGPGTWVRMRAGLQHSIFAESPLVMLLLMLTGSQAQ